MKREYAITIDVAHAQGLMASSYVNATGNGVLIVDGTDEQWRTPTGESFLVSGSIAKAWDMDGVKLDPRDIAKMHFGPVRYTVTAGAQTFTGSNWTATLSLTFAEDQRTLQAVLEGSGTGLARFAAKNIRVIINGACAG